jgi:polar amino acid transport system substrate-binding protein
MDGFETTRRLREDARFVDMPIVAMTAHATMEERKKVLEAGMNDHVAKPIEPERLLAAIRTWIAPRIKRLQIQPPLSTSSSSPQEDISIPGIDFESAVKRLGGNRDLLTKLLKDFVEENRTFTERMNAFLKAGNRTEAMRLAHTAKGVAGNLGAVRHQSLAMAIEKEIQAGDDDAVHSSLRQFDETLSEMTASLGAREETVDTGVLDAERLPRDIKRSRYLAPKLEHLARLLEACDGEASMLYNDIEDFLSLEVGVKPTKRLGRLIERFTFEEAAQQLAVLKLAVESHPENMA